jgi:hypothetical protein
MLTSMKPARFRPTPTTLKWLVEKRARTAHDLKVAKELIEELTLRAVKLDDSLSALDKVIQLYDPAVTPALIEPINGWAGNYGTRGGLGRYVADVIKAESPNWIATPHIEAKAIAHFGISFDHQSQRKAWRNGSFRGTLKKLCREGFIEREHDPDQKTGFAGRWRWKTESTTLAELERDDET